MAHFNLKLPKMGESVAEATVTKWLKEIGDTIELDESIVEIATDKVDSDVPSEVAGVLIEKRFQEDDIVKVGEVMAVIEVEGELAATSESLTDIEVEMEEQPEVEAVNEESPSEEVTPVEVATEHVFLASEIETVREFVKAPKSQGDRFYSPLVKNIAKREGITEEELQYVEGTGKDNRVTKNDILKYIENRTQPTQASSSVEAPTEAVDQKPITSPQVIETPKAVTVNSGKDQIIEMTRMGKMISEHMLMSKRTSAHVQSFVEVDVTELWNWREKVKNTFAQRENEKLTFTPLFIKAVAASLRDFPLLNSAVDGNKIIQKGEINIGMATALADGNLIVPVIKNADHLNIIGLAKKVNDLAIRARNNALKPDEVQGGTYTVTNVGNFGSIMGTPIINQPQVGILAIGAIRKMPAVIETPEGDFIGIRKKLILSHSYDHRIINGAIGGQFVKSVADYLENWKETLPY